MTNSRRISLCLIRFGGNHLSKSSILSFQLICNQFGHHFTWKMDRKRASATRPKNPMGQSQKVSTSSSDYVPDRKSMRSQANETDAQRRTRIDYAENPLFSRFWYTANVTQMWLRNHRGFVDQFNKMPGPPQELLPPPPPPFPPPPFPSVLFSGAIVRKSSKRSKKRKINAEGIGESPKMMEVSEECVVSISSIGEDGGGELEEEISEKMDLSEDVIAFMAQTVRHRIEREKKKAYEQEIQEKTVVFVPADRPFMVSRFNEFGGNASAVVDMLQHRGGDDGKLSAAEKKRQEMIRLYGIEAAGRIQAEETLMQMKFDQEYDKDHPPFWPNIPLKL